MKFLPGTSTDRTTPILDMQCKICDMAGNCYEWSTETSNETTVEPCVVRGGCIIDTSHGAGSRWHIRGGNTNQAFRPILYL